MQWEILIFLTKTIKEVMRMLSTYCLCSGCIDSFLHDLLLLKWSFGWGRPVMSISFKYLALGRHLWINTCFFLSLCEHPLLLQKEAGPELVQAAGFATIVSQTITESSTKINSHLSDKKRVFLVGCNRTVLVLVNSTVISMWWCWRALGVPWVCFIPAPGAEMATRVLLVNLIPRFS